MIDTISNIIENEIHYAYCDNCKYQDDDFDDGDHCEMCHRKYIGWVLSQEEAVRIANKIIEAINDF